MKEEVYEILDELQGSGVTNMYNAPSVLMDVLGISRAEARAYVSAWMEDKNNG